MSGEWQVSLSFSLQPVACTCIQSRTSSIILVAFSLLPKPQLMEGSTIYQDACTVYDEDRFYERCRHFVIKTFEDQLDKTIVDLRKRYGPINPSKEAFIAQLKENSKGRIRFPRIYDRAAVKWNQHLGIMDDEDNGKMKRLRIE
jgi:hypothetical protein